MYSVDIYSRVRRACLKDGMSARAAARYFNKDRKTIAKMLRHALPPGYRQKRHAVQPLMIMLGSLMRYCAQTKLSSKSNVTRPSASLSACGTNTDTQAA